MCYEIVNAALFASRLTRAATREEVEWSVRVELRGVLEFPLAIDWDAFGSLDNHVAKDDIIHFEDTLTLPLQVTGDPAKPIAELVDGLLFPFTCTGAPPVSTNVLIKRINELAVANRFWDTLIEAPN